MPLSVTEQLLIGVGKLASALPPAALKAALGRRQRVNSAGMILDAKAQLICTLTDRFAIPPSLENLARARAQFDRFRPVFDGVRIPLERILDVDMSSSTHSLKGRLYLPETNHPSPLPLLVFFHGGGFTYGGLDDDRGPCPRLAHRGKFAVLSVDYALAPEQPFPAALDDAIAAFRWAVDNGDRLGVDASRIAVGGDSAGGCLSAALSVAMRDRGGPHPAFQLLIYPMTDARGLSRSREEFDRGFFLDGRDIEFFQSCYTPNPEDRADPRVSPLLTEDLRALPDAFVLTAGFDPLRDEGKEYAERLRLAGVNTHHVCYEDMVHGFIGMAGALPQGVAALDECADAVRAALSS